MAAKHPPEKTKSDLDSKLSIHKVRGQCALDSKVLAREGMKASSVTKHPLEKPLAAKHLRRKMAAKYPPREPTTVVKPSTPGSKNMRHTRA